MDIEKQIDTLIKDLSESEALIKPEPHAGYMLVDPVIPAAIQYWWDKYKESKDERNCDLPLLPV